jgi:hypothetical protein
VRLHQLPHPVQDDAGVVDALAQLRLGDGGGVGDSLRSPPRDNDSTPAYRCVSISFRTPSRMMRVWWMSSALYSHKSRLMPSRGARL